MVDATDGNKAILSCPPGMVINVGSARYGTMADASCNQDIAASFINPLVNGVTSACLDVNTDMTGNTYCSSSINKNRLSVEYQCQTSGIYDHDFFLFL